MTADSSALPVSPEQADEQAPPRGRGPSLVWYFVLGSLFGLVLIKSEVVSWFRIQEMFRFQSFHMFGVLATAIAVAALALALLKRLGALTRGGEPISVAPKILGRGYRYVIGGVLFGVGWVLTGACPGPLFALLGGGATVYAAAILAALAGTWLYGALRSRLPHY